MWLNSILIFFFHVFGNVFGYIYSRHTIFSNGVVESLLGFIFLQLLDVCWALHILDTMFNYQRYR